MRGGDRRSQYGGLGSRVAARLAREPHLKFTAFALALELDAAQAHVLAALSKLVQSGNVIRVARGTRSRPGLYQAAAEVRRV